MTFGIGEILIQMFFVTIEEYAIVHILTVAPTDQYPVHCIFGPVLGGDAGFFQDSDILQWRADRTVCSDVFVFLPQKQHLSGGRTETYVFSSGSCSPKIPSQDLRFPADDRQRSNIRQTEQPVHHLRDQR